MFRKAVAINNLKGTIHNTQNLCAVSEHPKLVCNQSHAVEPHPGEFCMGTRLYISSWSVHVHYKLLEFVAEL